jgi:hypothetical protein
MNNDKIRELLKIYVDKYDGYLSCIFADLLYDEDDYLDIGILQEEIDIARYKGKIYDDEIKKWWKIVEKHGSS